MFSPTRGQKLADPLLLVIGMETEVFQSLTDDIADGHTGVQGCIGVLEDHLGSLFEPQAVFFSKLCHITAGVLDDTLGSRVKAKDRALPQVVLPQPDSPTRPRVSPL